MYAVVKKFSEIESEMAKLDDYQKHYVSSILSVCEKGGLGLNE